TVFEFIEIPVIDVSAEPEVEGRYCPRCFVIVPSFTLNFFFGRSMVIVAAPLNGLPRPFLWVFGKYIIALGSGVGRWDRVLTHQIFHDIGRSIGYLPSLPIALWPMDRD